ncbi:Uncharacterized membrane protein YoaK, UPF0700 family [Micrococcales bacterium KH10]|nr:Uncharacterized membrane protein YoaK, UPF0700 family [Micrococcales bacterium KH10]
MSQEQPRVMRADRINLITMVALTMTTGIIDAIGYLGLDRVFTANMTGNVVILAIGSTGTDGLPVAGPLVALVAYVLGALIGGRVLRRTDTGWHRTTTLSFLATGFFVLLLAPAVMWRTPVYGTPWALSITGVLGIAMGLQAATARRVSVKDVTTVVVTSTLTGLAADSYLAGGTSPRWVRRLAAVVALVVGAAIGAVLVRISLPLGFAVAGMLIIAIVTVGALAHHKQ